MQLNGTHTLLVQIFSCVCGVEQGDYIYIFVIQLCWFVCCFLFWGVRVGVGLIFWIYLTQWLIGFVQFDSCHSARIRTQFSDQKLASVLPIHHRNSHAYHLFQTLLPLLLQGLGTFYLTDRQHYRTFWLCLGRFYLGYCKVCRQAGRTPGAVW